ncbi:MAG: hypothetical protein ACLQO1_01650 [Steroidobacteraceae bacterium]
MPLVTDDQEPAGNAPVAQLPQSAPVQTSAQSPLDVVAAAERQSNVVSMLYDRYVSNPKPNAPAVSGFDPLASVPSGYEHYADRFLDSESPQETQWIKGRIDSELQDRQTIARAGGWGVAASLAAGATDPLTIASMAIPVGGATRLAQAARLAGVAAGTTTVQEGIAQALSPVRTLNESLTNVGTSAILGGLIGSVIRPRVPASEFEALRERFDAATPAPVVNPTGESTAGAAAVIAPTLADNTIAGVGDAIAKSPVGMVAPGLRLLTSPSTEARELVQQLAETREVLTKNLEGVATPTAVETILRGYEGDWYQGLKARAEAFRDYRERLAGTDETPLSRREFGEEVAATMRRGDQNMIPEVAQAARDTRSIVFDPLKVRAQALGLLPEDVKAEGAMSYLMRQYDIRKIRANMGDWLDTLTDGFKAQGVEAAEARDIAYKATRNVLGSERGTMDWKVLDDVVPKSGQMKERTIKLPDEVLEPFLTNDIDHLSHSYLRSMAPEVEMTERFGNRDLAPQIDAIKDEYSRLIERADSDSAKQSLYSRMEADITDVSAIRDRLYGIYGQPKDPAAWGIRAMRATRSLNALRLLGGATISHFPDIANVIMKYGLPNTMRAISKLGTSLEAIKVTRAEARRMGVGLDMVMNTTAALLGDYGSHSRFLEQRLIAKTTRAFTIGTLETPLITTIQSLASALGSDGLLRTAEAAAQGSLPQQTITRLAASGIDADMLKRIATEAAAHGQEVNGLKFGMSDKWTDQGAAQAFESAILKDAHAMTLSPGAGDTPLWMSTELGKTVLQFKSFAFAASRHVLMPIAQGVPAGDVRATTGLLSLIGAGYLSYVTKQWLANQPIEVDNPQRLALEILDKSNLLGWTGEVIYPALWMMGFKDFSRWSDRDPVETLGGPSAGTIASLYSRRLPAKLLNSATDAPQPFNRSDLHFLRRLAPGQNLWYARRAVNGLEDSIGDLFDLPGESNADRMLAQAQ